MSKCKLAGVMVGAALIFSATPASAAEFHVGYSITGTKTTNHVFTTTAGTVTCKTVHSEGVVAITTSQITMTPKYNECTAFGFVNVPVTVNGCGFLVTSEGTTHLECPAGKAIEITPPGHCTTKVGPQTVGESTFANNADKTDITVTLKYAGITYDECGTVRSNATYTGATTITSSSGAIWFE